ncbi:MAG: RIP metalloprotease RseP [Gammaproteobacteria bacterium]|nr:RIP metalloprotease RseP [Gammaproteobacteria bacterium]
MDTLTQIFAFLVTVLVLVSIHEAGHMVVARVLGIKVLRYSIGFGKALWKRTSKKSGVEYVIAMIPLGGYVNLVDERNAPVSEDDKPYAFNRKPLWVRSAVVAAGPVTNLILAVLIYWIMFSVGVETVQPIIGKITPQSLAANADMQSGDIISQIDGKPVTDWSDIMLTAVSRIGGQGELTIETRSSTGRVSEHKIDVSRWKTDPLTPDPLQSLGFEPYRPALPAVVENVKEGSVADKAGVKPGDRFFSINGSPVKDWADLVTTIQPHPGETFKFILIRDGIPIALTFASDKKFMIRGFKNVGVIGVTVKPTSYPETMKFVKQYNPIYAVFPAIKETVRFFDFNFVVMKKLVMGELSLKTLGGPITIFGTADRAFKAGLIAFVNFLALMSVMLAFVNVLPIPGLDGGHLLYFLIEFIIRRPLSMAVEIVATRIGFVLLILLTLAAVYNDILRLIN